MFRASREKALKKLRKEMRAGLYSYLVLSLLRRGEMHGYAIRKKLGELEVAPSEGALYDILKSLQKLGLVESFWVEERRPRKLYRLTELGREVLEELEAEIGKILVALEKIEGIKGKR